MGSRMSSVEVGRSSREAMKAAALSSVRETVYRSIHSSERA